MASAYLQFWTMSSQQTRMRLRTMELPIMKKQIRKVLLLILEGIAKLALGAKFDDFFAQAVFRKLTYMVECRQFAKKRPARKKREFGPKWSFAIPSLLLGTALLQA